MDQAIYDQIQSKVNVKHTYYMNSLDLRKITKLVYGSSIEMLENPNGTTHEYFVVSGGLNDNDQKSLDEAIQAGGLEHWNYVIILDDLSKKGYLQAGRYFIS